MKPEGQESPDTDIDRLQRSLGVLPLPVPHPVLITISGLPGTGKTYLARRIAERLPLALLESDALRKTLFPRPDYSPAENTRLFSSINRLMGRLLDSDISVLLDATNLTENVRQRYYRMARRHGAPLYLVLVEAPPSLVRRRLKERQGCSGCRSDADWTVYQKMKAGMERIRRPHYMVDTSKDITPFITKFIQDIKT